jgi:hypothetical protein
MDSINCNCHVEVILYCVMNGAINWIGLNNALHLTEKAHVTEKYLKKQIFNWFVNNCHEHE